MIPCYICGKDASTSYVKGLPPAPDSQKLGLCHLHDNPENRITLQKAWQEMCEGLMKTAMVVAEHKAVPMLYSITVNFIGGGVLSFVGTRCQATPQGTLAVEEQNGETAFIPMQHIREYLVRPVPTADVISSDQ